MIIGFLPSAINSLPITNDDAHIVAFSNLEMLIGSIQMDEFDGTIAVWGDDNATDEIDGAEPFTEVKLQLVNLMCYMILFYLKFLMLIMIFCCLNLQIIK